MPISAISAKNRFSVGDHKRLPNEVGGRQTAPPKSVGAEIKALLKGYGPRVKHPFDDILGFHVAFERIHPFQDGNGRVGRLAMFKERLASDPAPFIVADDMKALYYRWLSERGRKRGFLSGTCTAARDGFKATLDYFGIPCRE